MEVLKMERPMDSWNDERLDELSRRMDEGFKEMREGFARIDRRFEKVLETVATKEDIAKVNSRIDWLESRVDRLYYGCVALLVLLVGNSIVGNFVG